jgi:imidazolonepropionase-like amidohydrolase
MIVRRMIVAALALIAALAPVRAEIIAVKAGSLIDGTGAAPKKNQVVVVDEGKIVSVGTEIPKGATVIDLGDRTLLPGFIDCHVHLAGRVIGEGENWDDAAVRDLPQEDALRGARNAKATLEAGFTTVRNVGASDFSDIALRNMIRQGVVPGRASSPPATRSASRAATATPTATVLESSRAIRKTGSPMATPRSSRRCATR